jgi:hypothetical protein
MDDNGTLMVAASESKKLGDNTWENRVSIADELIEKLSEYAGTDTIHQVVFGLSQDMLTTAGDIEKGVKVELKKLSTMLDLTPVGFVNIDTAVVFQIKHDEGVPPSVILLHIQGEEMIMSLYRVGTCVGTRTMQKTEFIVEDVETAIKSFSDIEVLPSRILLFGDDVNALETIQSQLLTHQWPNRVNFLHYPKIDVMPMEDVARAVALAGASELASAMGIDMSEKEEELSEAKSRSAGEITVVAQPEEETVMGEEIIERTESISEDKDVVEEIDDAFDKDTDTDEEEKEEKLEEIKITPEDSNVVAVSPEALGFGKNEKISKIKNLLSGIHFQIPKIPITGVALPIGVVLFFIICIFGLLYYFLPKVTITVGVLPQVITKEKAVTISPSATIADAEKFIVPGKKQEKSVTGEKTMPVAGKKKIGDPARGTVTVYNKTTATKLLKKGTVIEYKSLEFTLDGDVEVASASESIGSITFGTTNAAATASIIGEEGNIGVNTEFSVKGYDASVLIARNAQAFTGGTSRLATVVSRADYDALIKALTDELVATAQAELLQEVTGGEKLIKETIKTSVTSKTFTEELDQEATTLHGKATITVTGTSYKEDDIKMLLLTLASKDIQSGYVMNEGRTTITVTNPVVKKDGTISAQASIQLTAIPNIDVDVIRKSLVGKSFIRAQEQLRQIQGIGSAEFIFKPWRGNKILPIKPTNIIIEVVVAQ